MNLKALPFFRHVKWQPDARELRRFAIAMLIGFSVLAALSAWRAKGIGTSAIVLLSTGVVLALAAFVPKLGRVTYLGIYLPTSVIGYVVSNVMLTLMFFLVITPLAMIMRLLRKDVLQQRRHEGQSQWLPVKRVKTEDSYYRQF